MFRIIMFSFCTSLIWSIIFSSNYYSHEYVIFLNNYSRFLRFWLFSFWSFSSISIVSGPATTSYGCSARDFLGQLPQALLSSDQIQSMCAGLPEASAHAGRCFHDGVNAFWGVAEFIEWSKKIMDNNKDVTVNIGKIEGGGPSNVVPDLGICRFNSRVVNKTQQKMFENVLSFPLPH